MTYGYLKTLNTPWTMSHVIDDFCSNARFCNMKDWKNDSVSEYEMGVLNHWADREGFTFPNHDKHGIPNHLFYGTPGEPCTTCNEKHAA